MQSTLWKRVRRSVALGLALAAAVPLLAQNGRQAGPQAGRGGGAAIQPLTADETRWLLFMREEEKLARDVYLGLNAQWKLDLFARIAESEQRHFDAIGVLLTRYGVPDPALDKGIGEFTNDPFPALYASLMAAGTASVQGALEAGLQIETKDVEDLQAALAATSKTDLRRVYSNLLAGSLNHLDAFESHLQVLAANP